MRESFPLKQLLLVIETHDAAVRYQRPTSTTRACKMLQQYNLATRIVGLRHVMLLQMFAILQEAIKLQSTTVSAKYSPSPVLDGSLPCLAVDMMHTDSSVASMGRC